MNTQKINEINSKLEEMTQTGKWRKLDKAGLEVRKEILNKYVPKDARTLSFINALAQWEADNRKEA